MRLPRNIAISKRERSSEELFLHVAISTSHMSAKKKRPK